jgi:hypothetical protein
VTGISTNGSGGATNLLDRLGERDDRIDEAAHPVQADGEAERQDQAGGHQDRAHGLVDVVQGARARGAQAEGQAGAMVELPGQHGGIERSPLGLNRVHLHGGVPDGRAHQRRRHDGFPAQVQAIAAVG